MEVTEKKKKTSSDRKLSNWQLLLAIILLIFFMNVNCKFDKNYIVSRIIFDDMAYVLSH